MNSHTVEGLYVRFWTMSLLCAATRVGLAPATRDQLFALAYLANAVADSLNGDAVQRSFLKKEDGPQLGRLAGELDRLVGLGLARVTRVILKKAAHSRVVIEPQYFIPDAAQSVLEEAVKTSTSLQATLSFHHSVATSFVALGASSIVNRSTIDASYTETTVGESDIVDLGATRTHYPTEKAIELVRRHLPRYQHPSAFAAVQVYGRFLATYEPVDVVKG